MIPLKEIEEVFEDMLSEMHQVAEFLLLCKPTQCLLRKIEYARPNKMFDHVKKNLQNHDGSDSISCPHPKCKANSVVLPGIEDFKNHAARVHEILLHA